MRNGFGSWALVLLLPLTAQAQETRPLPELPAEVEARVRAMRSDPGALRLSGPAEIAAGRTVAGGVVADGSLTVVGRIEGDVLVAGGDLLLMPGAAIGGDVLVVGGAIEGAEQATVGGTLLSFGPAEPGRDHADRRRRDKSDGDWHHWPRRDDDDEDGGIDLGVSIAGNYNRVEGLPVMFGPVIQTAGPNRLRVSGQAIWRTEPSESLDDEIGYQVRLEQGLFGGQLRVGGEVASLVRAIETRGLNSTEASLAAVLFHSDLHDYYGDEGWAARVELRPRALPLEARLTYRQAEHAVLEESDPWSLFDGDDDWRPQPVVATGDVSTLELGLRLDTRDDEQEPTRGIFAALSVEHALDQELVMPGIDLDGTVGGGLRFDDFTTGQLDLRAYLPVNRNSTLNVRGVAAGSIEEAVLPPQYQRAFGGIGTLPGFSLFSGSCGSRAVRVRLVTEVDPIEGNTLSDEAMLPAYGCDRVLLGQLEYRGGFDIGEEDEDEDDWHHVDMSAEWAFFVDVARGWSYGNMTFVERGNTDTMADVGFGVLFDQAGVYVAMPITGDDQSLRAIVRLQRRF